MSAFDTVTAFRFVNRLTKPWDEWDAYKLGLIDDNGDRLKKAKSKEEKKSMDRMTIITKNIKRLLGKLPGGNSKFLSVAAALFLMKESEEPQWFDSFISSTERESGFIHEATETDVVEGQKYSVEKELFEDLEEVSGVVVVESLAYVVKGLSVYKVKDIVTRNTLFLPGDLLKEFK